MHYVLKESVKSSSFVKAGSRRGAPLASEHATLREFEQVEHFCRQGQD